MERPYRRRRLQDYLSHKPGNACVLIGQVVTQVQSDLQGKQSEDAMCSSLPLNVMMRGKTCLELSVRASPSGLSSSGPIFLRTCATPALHTSIYIPQPRDSARRDSIKTKIKERIKKELLQFVAKEKKDSDSRQAKPLLCPLQSVKPVYVKGKSVQGRERLSMKHQRTWTNSVRVRSKKRQSASVIEDQIEPWGNHLELE